MTDHPITPPPELIKDWHDEWNESDQIVHSAYTHIAIRAAQWGSDQELEACCKLLELSYEWDDSACKYLRAERRPKPPTLKEQALKELNKVDILWATEEFGKETLNSLDTIRKALEALPDD